MCTRPREVFFNKLFGFFCLDDLTLLLLVMPGEQHHGRLISKVLRRLKVALAGQQATRDVCNSHLGEVQKMSSELTTLWDENAALNRSIQLEENHRKKAEGDLKKTEGT
ncbi:hypothetical protein NE237_028425 [Protea cynaroides]|uniref:Uncharacterized protein n=1 Tax=Protea cynaroides TaxID=273540 RepID=A0A9Q0GS06_9MAGN|nr:hypothetical protein NE237_028425 [Protea cynaroides]